MSKADKAKLSNRLSENAFRSNTNAAICPLCQAGVEYKQMKDTDIKIMCGNCRDTYCKLCARKWKNGSSMSVCGNKRCSTEAGSTAPAKEIMKAFKGKTTTINGVTVPMARLCPISTCQNAIIHLSGCKHMTCRFCTVEFCWMCLCLAKKEHKGSDKWPCGSHSDKCKVAPEQNV